MMGAVDSLLAPGVRLMSRLSYPRKFVLISLLFAIPLALLMSLWLHEIGKRIAFAEKERAGLEYVVALRQLLEPLERSRALALLAPGDEAAAGLLAEEHARTLAATRAVDVVAGRLRPGLETGEQWHTLRRGVVTPSVQPTALIEGTRRLIAHVGDASNLILDPDLDSYYLMDTVVNRLPALARHLGTVGAGLVEQRVAGSLRGERRGELLATMELVRTEQAALDRVHAVALRANPALGSSMSLPVIATQAAVDEIAIMMNDAGISMDLPAGPALGPRETLDRYTHALGAVFTHYDAAAAALDERLAARIGMLSMRRSALLLVVALAMAIVAYLWVSFYVAVKRAVTALDGVSKRMLTGEFSGPVVVDSRDELRQVVGSFNTVAERLRTEWARAQEESARAHAAEASLIVARDAAEAATRAKSRFLAVMSHEIRTPMNGILGMTHLLLGTRLDAEQRRFAEAVRDSGDALLTILNDVLDFSKMEAGKLDLATVDFDLAGLIASVTALMGPRAREKELALEAAVAPDVPRVLRGDAGRLRQILLNLVVNALKFTETGSVRVQVDRVARPGDAVTLRFAVSDTGIGITEQAQQRLFEEFSQVSQPEDRRFGGTGLGLAISKRIVAAMGGEIGVQSAPGHGSTFWFTATLPVGSAEVSDGPTSLDAPLAPLRILVAEDNRMNQQVALGLLQRQGHQVDLVADGRAAVAAVGARDYDVVLMDVHMPGMDGLEATRQIRQLPGDRGRVPIIALTASVMRDETEHCLAAGMNAQLPKPIDPIALATAVSHHARAVGGAGPARATPAAGPDVAGRPVGDRLDRGPEAHGAASGRPESAQAGIGDPPESPTAGTDRTSTPRGDARRAVSLLSAETPGAVPTEPAEPVVDEAYVRVLVDALGPRKVRELIAGMPADAHGYRDRLMAAGAHGDLPGARAAAHGLKGIAANLGLTALAHLAAAIEEACASGAPDRVTALGEQLDARLDAALSQLRALVR